jgi:hypothetical protein
MMSGRNVPKTNEEDSQMNNAFSRILTLAIPLAFLIGFTSILSAQTESSTQEKAETKQDKTAAGCKQTGNSNSRKSP